MKASIIICTHNHAASLRKTLAAFERLVVPAGLEVEMLLVENACTDETPVLVEAARLKSITCRALHEPKKGQVRARNLGLSKAQGDLILFTDDDVCPQPDWLERIAARLVDGHSDALIGRVRLAPHLERPWLTRRLRAMLAASEGLEDGWLTEMIGANATFHRRVLDRVPRFDEELGPGALGFGDDSLFSWQLEKAGFRLGRAPEAVVEHHCDEARLLRTSFLDAAAKQGRSQAYLLHHWRHQRVAFPIGWLALLQLKLARRRITSGSDAAQIEGCAQWEIALAMERAFYRHYLVERRRPRNYERFGLVKLPAATRQDLAQHPPR
jgi:glycosyltransferase involved in cell wall biosynthesis